MRQSADWFASARVLLLVAALCSLPSVIRAVLVTPPAVFMDDRTRTAQLSLQNPGAEAEELTITLKFGYPATDSSGSPFINFIADSTRDEHDATAWLRAFPRQVRLEPGDQQTVRLLAAPPAGLPDGEYWTRYVVTSRPASAPAVRGDSGVRVTLTMAVATIGAVVYRKGAVVTGVHLTTLTARTRSDSLVARLGLERTGNAAFQGTARFALTASDGRRIAEWPAVPLAVYYAGNQRFALPRASIPSGRYTLDVVVTSGRPELQKGQALPADPVHGAVAIAVP